MEEVRNWLRGLGLEEYAPKFEAEGWDTLEILVHMKPSEIESCIPKVGHRRKFEIGLKTHPPACRGYGTRGHEKTTSESSKKVNEDQQHTYSCQGSFQTSESSEQSDKHISTAQSLLNITEGVITCTPSFERDSEKTLVQETVTHPGSLCQTEESQYPGHNKSMSDSKAPSLLPVKEAHASSNKNKLTVAGKQEMWVDEDLAETANKETSYNADTLRQLSINGNQEQSQIDVKWESPSMYASLGLVTIPRKKNKILLTTSNTGSISDSDSLGQIDTVNHKGPTFAALEHAGTYINENQKETSSNEDQGETFVDDNNLLTSISDSRELTYIGDNQKVTHVTESCGVVPIPSISYTGKADETSTCVQLPSETLPILMDPEENISAENFGCNTQNTDIVDVVCVKGVRNKIIKTDWPQNTENELTGRKVYPQGFLVVKDSVEKSQHGKDLLLNRSSTDSDDNSAVDEDMGVDARAHQWMMCKSGGSFAKATIVKNSKNVTVAHKAEVHHHVHKAEEKKQRDNFKDQILNVVQSYRKKDHLFVETNAYQEMGEILEDSQWALITGKPGDGKTAMAAHLLLKYIEKGFEPLIVTNAQDWKEMVKGTDVDNKNDKQFVMIDNMFGSMIVDDRKVNEWLSLIDIMHRVVKERKGSLVVICTSRTYVFKDVKSKMEKFPCFQNKSTIDLTEEIHALTCSEKNTIWMNYTKEYNVVSDIPNCIYTNVKSPHGFPHCVELYCKNQFLREKGVAFFENPMEYVCQEIQNFKENDKIKYCLLLLILYNNNRLEESLLQEICLSEPPKEIMRVFKAAGISSDYAQSELKKALNSLMNTYVCENMDQTYGFSHESIRENIAFIYIKDNPLHAIEDIDIKYLVDHTRYAGQKHQNTENIFVLPLFCANALVARTVKEIKKGMITIICQHQAWEDPEFVRKWLSYILLQSSAEERDTNYIRDIFRTMNNYPLSINWEADWYSDYTLFEMLLYYKRERAVLEILNNEHIIRHLKVSEETLLSRALLCACLFLPSEEIVKKFLKAGADINFMVSREEYSRYTNYWHLRRLHLSDLYNPLISSVFTANKSLLRLLMKYEAKFLIGEEPVALIVAVQLGLYEIVEEIVQYMVTWNQSSVSSAHVVKSHAEEQSDLDMLAIWNCRFMRYIPKLQVNCSLCLIHLVIDVSTLNLLLQKGVRVNEDIVAAETRIPHCIFRIINGVTIDIFEALLQGGMEVTGTWLGKTVLHYMIENLPATAIAFYVRPTLNILLSAESLTYNKETNFGVLTHLIARCSQESSVNATDSFNRSGLHYLFLFEIDNSDGLFHALYQIVFKEMIRWGADVNIQDRSGTTPAMLALTNCTDSDLILDCVNKRQPKLMDSSGKGYFHYLASSKLPAACLMKIVTILLEAGEDINLQDKAGNVPLFECNPSSFKVFYNFGGCIEVVNKSGQNFFCSVLQRGIDVECLEILEIIKYRLPNLQTSEKSGRCYMHFLMAARTDGFFRFKLVFEYLVSLGYNPEKPDINGITPLMLAAENKCFNELFFAFLLDGGFDFYGTDTNGMSILHHLLQSRLDGYETLIILRLLLSHLKDLFTSGRDLLAFAMYETSCDFETVLELFKYRQKSTPDDTSLAIGLLMSNRQLSDKIQYLLHLIMTKKIKLSMRKLLLSSTLSSSIKKVLTNELLQANLIKPEDIIASKGDVLLLCELTDDMAVTMMGHLEYIPELKRAFSDMHLISMMCKHDFPKSIEHLLRFGITYLDTEGNTLLHKLIECITDDKQLSDILKWLMDRKDDFSHPNKEMMTPLHVACRMTFLKPISTYMIISNMRMVDQKDSSGMTALSYLCSRKDKKSVISSYKFDVVSYLVFCLISKGANVDHHNLKGLTAIMAAISKYPSNDTLLSVLIENSKEINKEDVSGNTALHYIARASMNDGIKVSVIRLIEEKGGDIKRANKDGQTFLSILQNQIHHKQVGIHMFREFMLFENMGCENDVLDILFRHLALVMDESRESLKAIENIITERKIDINARHDVNSSTMLMIACESLLPEVTRHLLSLKANPNVGDMIGCTCLSRLLCSRALKYMSVLYVCYIGGDIHKETLLHFLNFFWDERDTQVFLSIVADTEIRYSVGNENCSRAAEHLKNKGLDILQTLLSSGADPNMSDISGKTPLHHFVQSPLADIFICPAISLLIVCGANVNSQDCEGMTPLMACSQFPGRKSRRLNILIAAGANIKQTNNFGSDAIEYGKKAFWTMHNIYRC